MDDVSVALARIELKLESLITRDSDHEARLRVLEAGYVTRGALYRALTALTGMIGVTVALVSLVTR